MTCLNILSGKNKILFAKEKFFKMNYNEAENKYNYKYTCKI